MYEYINICTHKCRYTSLCICIYYINIYTYEYIYIHIYIYIYKRMYIYEYIYIHKNGRISTRVTPQNLSAGSETLSRQDLFLAKSYLDPTTLIHAQRHSTTHFWVHAHAAFESPSFKEWNQCSHKGLTKHLIFTCTVTAECVLSSVDQSMSVR